MTAATYDEDVQDALGVISPIRGELLHRRALGEAARRDGTVSVGWLERQKRDLGPKARQAVLSLLLLVPVRGGTAYEVRPTTTQTVIDEAVAKDKQAKDEHDATRAARAAASPGERKEARQNSWKAASQAYRDRKKAAGGGAPSVAPSSPPAPPSSPSVISSQAMTSSDDAPPPGDDVGGAAPDDARSSSLLSSDEFKNSQEEEGKEEEISPRTAREPATDDDAAPAQDDAHTLLVVGVLACWERLTGRPEGAAAELEDEHRTTVEAWVAGEVTTLQRKVLPSRQIGPVVLQHAEASIRYVASVAWFVEKKRDTPKVIFGKGNPEYRKKGLALLAAESPRPPSRSAASSTVPTSTATSSPVTAPAAPPAPNSTPAPPAAAPLEWPEWVLFATRPFANPERTLRLVLDPKQQVQIYSPIKEKGAWARPDVYLAHLNAKALAETTSLLPGLADAPAPPADSDGKRGTG